MDINKKREEIREIVGGAADPEAYAADKVGVSWERSAPIFGDFKRAGYVAVEPLIEDEPDAPENACTRCGCVPCRCGE